MCSSPPPPPPLPRDIPLVTPLQFLHPLGFDVLSEFAAEGTKQLNVKLFQPPCCVGRGEGEEGGTPTSRRQHQPTSGLGSQI